MKKVIIIFAAATLISCCGQKNQTNTMKIELIKSPVTVGLGTPDISLDYETWERLLLRSEYVSFAGKNYAVYDAPEGNKIFENTEHRFLPYSVIQVRGDWIKVEKARGGREGYFEGVENAEGWVKWKNDTEILVDIIEFSVE